MKTKPLFTFLLLYTLLSVACQERQPAVQEILVDSSGISIFVRLVGDPAAGDVLIGINGGPGLASHYMASLEQLVNRNLAIVTYDQRGTGRSGKPAATPVNYELADYVQDLDAIRDAIGVEGVHLFGHSWGGVVAMHYAASHPDRVKSMVLHGSGPPTDKAMANAEENLANRIIELQQNDIIPENLPNSGQGRIEAILPAYFSDPTFSLTDEERPKLDDNTNRLTWRAIRGYDITGELSDFHRPVLILYGADDPFGWPMMSATYQAFDEEWVEFDLLESCGHFWQECSDTFFPKVQAFLEANSG